MAKVLDRCLELDAPVVRRAAIPLIISMGHGAGIKKLRSLAESADMETVRIIIENLVPSEGTAFEPLLIKKLGAEDDQLVLAVIQALSKYGGAKAVEPLMHLRSELSLVHREKRLQIESAIAQIQSRLGPAERGTLTVTETEGPAGAVSLGSEGGEVSMPDQAGMDK
jgi:HEAT repeat protein